MGLGIISQACFVVEDSGYVTFNRGNHDLPRRNRAEILLSELISSLLVFYLVTAVSNNVSPLT